MKKIEKGDQLAIHCYKHNGKLYQISSEAVVLEETDDALVCANYKTKITEADGRSYKTNEPAILIYYKNSWFNIIGQFKKHGLFYYCNIATPYIVEDDTIKYIDYDLDLRVFPDGGFRVLDNNEYNYHKKLYKYPKDIDTIVRAELSKLIEMKRANVGPFKPGLMEEYYETYKKMINL